MIKSKFAIGYVYVMTMVVLGLFALGMFFLTHPSMPMRNRSGSTNGAWIPGLIITFPCIVFFYIQLKKMVALTIYPDRLELKSLFFQQTIFKETITSIDLAARESINSMSSRLFDAIVIKWGETEKYVLSDIFYRNMPQLKQALKENYLAAPGTSPVFPEYSNSREPVPAGEEDATEKFAGNALFSVNGVILLAAGCIIIPIFRMGTDHELLFRWGAPAIVLVPLYFALGTQMFYFKLSDEYLIIKNHFFPWYSRGYRLKEIKNILIERPYKRSDTLRVTTRGFFSKAYAAGTLRRDTWKALEKRLKSAHISVRNELYH